MLPDVDPEVLAIISEFRARDLADTTAGDIIQWGSDPVIRGRYDTEKKKWYDVEIAVPERMLYLMGIAGTAALVGTVLAVMRMKEGESLEDIIERVSMSAPSEVEMLKAEARHEAWSDRHDLVIIETMEGETAMADGTKVIWFKPPGKGQKVAFEIEWTKEWPNGDETTQSYIKRYDPGFPPLKRQFVSEGGLSSRP